jgi:hypothetical protein
VKQNNRAFAPLREISNKITAPLRLRVKHQTNNRAFATLRETSNK